MRTQGQAEHKATSSWVTEGEGIDVDASQL